MSSLEELRTMFSYDPQTGELLQCGKRAGYIMAAGYRLLSVKKRRIYAHRLIWFLMTGQWPPSEIDHINQNKSDNRWNNLRLATRLENSRNQSITSKNTSGFKGVSFHTRVGRWRATIKYDGKTRHLGYFDDPQSASLAYLESANLNFGRFASL